jgi:ATP-binding cassette subfamily B protein
VLALVSERMGADLRTATLTMLELSLDFLAPSALAILMSRIGSGPSDRISYLAALARFCLRRADDHDRGADPVFDQPWLALATWRRCLHRLDVHLVRDVCAPALKSIASGRSDQCWPIPPGIRVVKAFAQEKREAEPFRDANAAQPGGQ